MSKINYVTGDATQPVTTPAIIAHICNNRGGWGAGFTGALSKRYGQPNALYRNNWLCKKNYTLGCVQIVAVANQVSVANMIAQDGYSRPGKPAINYDALAECLHELQMYTTKLLTYYPYTVHMPRIGTGLAGGDWAVIEPMIEQELCEKGIQVTVYDLPIT